MSEQDIHLDKYTELRSNHKHYRDLFIALYQLKTENKDELIKIYKILQVELNESKKCLPQNMVKDILNIIPYNNRYKRSYLFLAKLICDDYQVEKVIGVENISTYLFYKGYGIKLDKSADMGIEKLVRHDIHTENTIYRAIMYNDLERFIQFTERKEFFEDQKFYSLLYPSNLEGYSLLELCCYHGAIDCFKLLRTKFQSEITKLCLELSFLGGNQEIMSECLKYQKPDEKCMEYAIISHNIDFVTFLMNEYNIEIDLYYCGKYNNLDAVLVYFDQTNNINKCFMYSGMFNIPSLSEYFLSLGANINEKHKDGLTALHYAAIKNSEETVKFLVSHGININEKNKYGETALHYAAQYNNKGIAKLLISHGANINEKDKDGKTALRYALENNSKETAELLISHDGRILSK